MGRLEDRTAIVTGASRGIGKAIARAFGLRGAKIVATARTTEALEALVARLEEIGTEAIAVTADLSVEADIERIIDKSLTKFGCVDILVNNAGGAPGTTSFIEMEVGSWKKTMDICATGTFLCSKAAARSMIENGIQGRIINISSTNGKGGCPGLSAYNAAKAARRTVTRKMNHGDGQPSTVLPPNKAGERPPIFTLTDNLTTGI